MNETKGGAEMTKEQDQEIIAVLTNFVARVAEGKATCDAEIAIMPQVAQILLETTHSR